MAHFLFVHFPHSFPIGPLRVKLNFASETEENNRLTNSRFRFSNELKLWKSGSIYGMANMGTVPAQVQDIRTSFDISYVFGLNQVIIKNKLFAGLTVSDPFHGRVKVSSTTVGEGFLMNSVNERLGRNITVTIRWNFGRLKEKVSSALNNIDDLQRASDVY